MAPNYYQDCLRLHHLLFCSLRLPGFVHWPHTVTLTVSHLQFHLQTPCECVRVLMTGGSEGDGAPPCVIAYELQRTTGYYLITLITYLHCIEQMAILTAVCVCECLCRSGICLSPCIYFCMRMCFVQCISIRTCALGPVCVHSVCSVCLCVWGYVSKQAVSNAAWGSLSPCGAFRETHTHSHAHTYTLTYHGVTLFFT